MIVHHSCRKRHLTYPNEIPGIKRVEKMNILGVTVSHTLTFYNHVDVVVEKTARSLYAIKTIRAHGLDGNTSRDVTRATVVAQLLYGSPGWWRFLKADEKCRLPSVVIKAQQYGYLPTYFKTQCELRQALDENLFHSTRYNSHHILHRLLPQIKDSGAKFTDGLRTILRPFLR